MYLTPIPIQFESSSSNPLFLLIKQSRMTSGILRERGGLGSRADSAAKGKGFSSLVQLGSCFPFSPLRLQGRISAFSWFSQSLSSSSSSQTCHSIDEEPESPSGIPGHLCPARCPSGFIMVGIITACAKKQLLPRGLQHPRTKISLSNLIYFPVCVPEV